MCARGVVPFLGAMVLAPVARASPQAATEAETLFEQARQAMAEGRYAEACSKLERSEALDPGIGTEFNLARCYELSGRIASAWSTYVHVIAATHAAGQTERETVARQRASELEPRLAHARIHVDALHAPTALEVRLDGSVLDFAAWNTPIPVDRGEHVLEARAPSMAPIRRSFSVLREGEEVVVEVPAASPIAPLGPQRLAPPVSKPAEPASANRTQRVTAIALAGAALVGAGVGSYFGLRSISLASQATSHCDATGCDPQGFSTRTDARAAGDVATVSFVIGGAFLVAAAVVWLTAPSSPLVATAH